MRGYVAPDGGYSREVLRILAVAALVALLGAGCGSAARPREAADRGVPRTLAAEWEARASAIANAANAGQSCRAQWLAGSLRTEVIAAAGRVPPRLQAPLLEAVNALADRIACRHTVTVSTPQPPPKGPKPSHKKPPKKHGPPGHDKPGGDQENQS
jgi:hypothetical protein